MTFQEAIEDFRCERDFLRVPKEADGECTRTSEQFITHLIDCGVPLRGDLRVIHYDARTARYHPLKPKLLTRKEFESMTPAQRKLPGQYRHHSVFACGRLRIDWTARQFDPKAPFPVIWRTA